MRLDKGSVSRKGFLGRNFIPHVSVQIVVYSQADHVAFTILDADVNFLQRFYRASLGTSSSELIHLERIGGLMVSAKGPFYSSCPVKPCEISVKNMWKLFL